MVKKLLKGGKEKRDGPGGRGRTEKKQGRAEEKGKCRNRGTNITVVPRGFLFKKRPLGVREGKRDELRLNQVEYNNRLNHRKLLFLKVRNDLIPAILCDSAILESKEMIM